MALKLILLLVAAWILLGIIGAVVHGLLWLTFIAAVLFVVSMFFSGRLSRSRR